MGFMRNIPSLCVITVYLRNNRQVLHLSTKTTFPKMTTLGTMKAVAFAVEMMTAKFQTSHAPRATRRRPARRAGRCPPPPGRWRRRLAGRAQPAERARSPTRACHARWGEGVRRLLSKRGAACLRCELRWRGPLPDGPLRLLPPRAEMEGCLV